MAKSTGGKYFKFFYPWILLGCLVLGGCLPPKQVVYLPESPVKENPLPEESGASSNSEEIKKLEKLLKQLEEAQQRLSETQRKAEEALKKIEKASEKTAESVLKIQKAQEKIEAIEKKDQ